MTYGPHESVYTSKVDINNNSINMININRL